MSTLLEKEKNIALRFFERQPDSDGDWLWIEGCPGDREPVALRLVGGGKEVAIASENEVEGTAQYYWEQTPTDQKTMPGMWAKT